MKLKYIFETALGLGIIAGGLSIESNPIMAQSIEKFRIEELKNGTIGTLTTGHTFTPYADLPDVEYKRGVPLIIGGEYDGIGRITRLDVETKNLICKDQTIVNTADHAIPEKLEPIKKSEINTDPESMNNGLQGDQFIGLLPAGESFEIKIGSTLDNLGKLRQYRNSKVDNGFHYTTNLTKECLGTFVDSRPESNRYRPAQFINPFTGSITFERYNQQPHNIEGAILDSDSNNINTLFADQVPLSGLEIPPSHVPVIYNKVFFKGSYYNLTGAGTSGSSIFLG